MTAANGWYGVDLDKTVAHYTSWKGELHIGEPIPAMVTIIKAHLDRGDRVKIFTARVSEDHVGDNLEIAKVIQDWTFKVFGQRLEVTNKKDYGMIAFYDDRAIQVVPNEGTLIMTIVSDLESQFAALKKEYAELREAYEELLRAHENML